MDNYAAFVFYVNRPDLLKKSIDSFPALWPELTVLDNSGYGVDCELPDSVGVFKPPVPLSYSQGMNWMLQDAQAKGCSLILHFHSDAHSTNPKAVQELLDYARRDKAAGKRVCCWYTLHDVLWAINVEALADIGGCDTNFASYFSDNDMARRWELTGWTRVNSGVEGIGHVGSATINSDPKLKCAIGHLFPLQAELYRQKHGGPPGEEKFLHPYGFQEFDWKP